VTTLSPAVIEQKLRFDLRVCQKMAGDSFKVEAYSSVEDGRSRHKPLIQISETTRIRALLFAYRFRSLVGPGRFAEQFLFLVEPLAGGNYPYSDPQVNALSSSSIAAVWHHRIHPSHGRFCFGNIWSIGNGKFTLGHLAIQLCKVMNFDEPPGGDRGYNPAAFDYWHSNYNGRPLDPKARYPKYPSEDDLVGPSKIRLLGTNSNKFKPAS
jgi:hypothetical protein